MRLGTSLHTRCGFWDARINILWVCHGVGAQGVAPGCLVARVRFVGQLWGPALWSSGPGLPVVAPGWWRGACTPIEPCVCVIFFPFGCSFLSPCSAWRMYSMCLHQCVPSGEWPIGVLLSLCDRECAPVTPCKLVS